MPKQVPDSEENVIFVNNFVDQCKDNGYNCFGCGVFKKCDLKGAWLCFYGIDGKN